MFQDNRDKNIKGENSKAGGWTSLIVGAPIGIIAIFLGIMIPSALTGEGIFIMAYFGVNGYATIGLYISFLIILWFAGNNAYNDLLKGKNILLVSLKYSMTVNSVIWLTFILVHLISNGKTFDWLFGIVMPLILCFISMILTPFTFGLFICYLIKDKIPQPKIWPTKSN